MGLLRDQPIIWSAGFPLFGGSDASKQEKDLRPKQNLNDLDLKL